MAINCVKTFHIFDNSVDLAKEYPSHQLLSDKDYFVSGINKLVPRLLQNNRKIVMFKINPVLNKIQT